METAQERRERGTVGWGVVWCGGGTEREREREKETDLKVGPPLRLGFLKGEVSLYWKARR